MDSLSEGTVAVGKRADLVVVHANPLEDIRNAREIAGVLMEDSGSAAPISSSTSIRSFLLYAEAASPLTILSPPRVVGWTNGSVAPMSRPMPQCAHTLALFELGLVSIVATRLLLGEQGLCSSLAKILHYGVNEWRGIRYGFSA